jgi:hypothetical protein
METTICIWTCSNSCALHYLGEVREYFTRGEGSVWFATLWQFKTLYIYKLSKLGSLFETSCIWERNWKRCNCIRGKIKYVPDGRDVTATSVSVLLTFRPRKRHQTSAVRSSSWGLSARRLPLVVDVNCCKLAGFVFYDQHGKLCYRVTFNTLPCPDTFMYVQKNVV